MAKTVVLDVDGTLMDTNYLHTEAWARDTRSGSLPAPNAKPAPDVFEEILRKAEASAEDTVAVGDAVWDVESAKEAGIRTVAVLSGGAFSPQELEEAGPALLEAGFPG